MFHRSARAGDEPRARVTATGIATDGTVTLAAEVARVGDEALILSGAARVAASRRAISFDDSEVPGLVVQRHRHFAALLKRAEPLPALITAVVCPHDADALQGALLARQHSIVTPILVGEGVRNAKTAADCGADLSGIEVVEVLGEAVAAQAVVDLVSVGRVQAVMKGQLHTRTLLHPMLNKEGGCGSGDGSLMSS